MLLGAAGRRQRRDRGAAGARAARAGGAGGRRGARRRRHRLPGHVPQPARVARHPRRVDRRRARRGARHLPLAGHLLHPDLRLRRRPWGGRPGVLDRLAPARPRPAARAGADRRGDRHAARLGDRAAQVPCRPVQPAARHHLLAARQPGRDLAAGHPLSPFRSSLVGPRADAAAALAHEPARAARRRSARARRRRAQAAHPGGGLRHADDRRRRSPSAASSAGSAC